MLNFNKNKLINVTLDTYYNTFSHMLDTSDYVPEKFNNKIGKYIFKNLKKAFRRINKEDRKFQKQFRKKQRQKAKKKAKDLKKKQRLKNRNERKQDTADSNES